jgi:polyvinyl alcohol dehydrogenase (cytochrome)
MLRSAMLALLVVAAAACGKSEKAHDAPGVVAPPVADAVPCDVAAVLKVNCVMCHGATPQHSAPISLIHASDFTAPRANATVGQIALMRMQNDQRPMPPAPQARLSAGDFATLATWINGGALAAPDGCVVDDTPPTTVVDSGSGTTVFDAGALHPTTGSGGTTATTPDAGGSPANDAGHGTGEGTSTAWASFGHDLANTRTNPNEHTLSSANVKSLRRLWEFKGPASSSTPAVVGGVVYLPAWDGKVRALKATDGSMVWTSPALPNMVDSAPLVIDSSPTVTDTKVFVSDNNGGAHALERATGKVLWSVAVDKHPQAHLWSSPVYLPGPDLVILGVASGEEQATEPMGGYTFRGSVVGISGADGAQKWRFVTAEEGSSGPGVSVWATAAVDLGRKALFVGTGNNYAAPSSPHEDSLISLDIESGALRWVQQFTKDDLFTIATIGSGGPDYDIGSSANLFTVDGKDLVGVGIKNGNYVALDRDTGMVAWSAMLTMGGVLGGVISPSAYADGTIYVASNDMSNTRAFALNAKTGTQLWASMPEENTRTYGGLAYANGVVYWTTDVGTIHALDAATGKDLWSDKATDSIASGPSVVDGVLYVAWGYQWTLGDDGQPGTGGLIAYGL